VDESTSLLIYIEVAFRLFCTRSQHTQFHWNYLVHTFKNAVMYIRLFEGYEQTPSIIF